MGVSFSKTRRWSHVHIWPIIGLQNANIEKRLTVRVTVCERDWFSECWHWCDAWYARALAILRSSALARPLLFTTLFALWLPRAIAFSKAWWFVSPRLRIAEPTVTWGATAVAWVGQGMIRVDSCRERWCYQRRNQPASRITQYNLLDWMGRTEKATLRMEILEPAVTWYVPMRLCHPLWLPCLWIV